MPENIRIPDADLVPRLAANCSKPFGGAIAAVRDALTPDTAVVYRPLEALLLPPPWHVRTHRADGGRRAFATTPHLASGAGISVEDGLVLAEELAAAALDDRGRPCPLRRPAASRAAAWWSRTPSAWARSKPRADGSPADHQALMAASAQALALPI